MHGEIICVGDELISGRVAEGNSGYAASRLWPLGLGPARISLVGDAPPAIVELLGRALGRCDYLIVCGGLGTTEDDLTAQAAAEALGLPLIEHSDKIADLRALLEGRGRELTPEVRRMALMPQGAWPLDRRSAGFGLVSAQGQPLYFLPGVPLEFRRIVDARVVPELAAHFAAGAALSLSLRTYGLPESEVGRRLAGLSDERQGLGLGFYPVFPEVQVLITARAVDQAAAQAALAPLEAEVRARLEGHVIARGPETLEQVVGRLLSQARLTLTLAEACTGGLIGHRITQVPGSSGFFERGLVVYSNRAKQELLGVNPDTLAGHGAVSAECAAEMALGARLNGGSDLGLAVTGIAGPEGGSADKPVGTVHFGLSDVRRTQTQVRRFHGDRHMIKAQAAETALDWLRRHLESLAGGAGPEGPGPAQP